MNYLTSLTQKGQITIPKGLRDALQVKSYDKLYLQLENNHLKLYPAPDILGLAGKIKPKKKKPVLSARQKLDQGYQRF